MRARLPLLLVFALAVAAHVDSLTNWFASTDTLPLIASSRVSSTADLVGLFTNPLMHGTNFVQIALFYRPVASLTYALDHALWGLSPVGYHATNIVLHGIAAVLAAVTVAVVTDRPAAGYLAGGLFAIHPLTVEVVPTVARRQDILLSVFFLAALVLFVHGRTNRSNRLLGLSLIAFVLALGSKETAILLPGLIVVWVGLQDTHDGLRSAGRAAVRAVIPYAGATVGYLSVRIAVLGELGGYAKDSPLTLTRAVFVPIKYVLWLTQPVNTVEVVVAPLSPTVVLPALVLATIFVVPLGVNRSERAMAVRVTLFLLFIGGLASISLVLTYPSVIDRWNPFGETDTVVSYLVSLLFVGSCLAGAMAAMAASCARKWIAVGRPLVFFGTWLALPLGLFLLSDNLTLRPFVLGYSSHNSYLFIVPAMAIPSLLAVTAVSDGNGNTFPPVPASDMAMIAVVGLFLLPLVAATPLVHPYDGWQASGDVNERTLKGIAADIEGAPEGTTVVVEGLPEGIRSQHEAYPRVQSITPMRHHTVRAWLGLRFPDREYPVVIEGHTMVDQVDDPIVVERVASREREVRVRVSTASRMGATADPPDSRNHRAHPDFLPRVTVSRGSR